MPRSSSPTPTCSAAGCSARCARQSPRHVVVAAEPITDVDSTAAEVLSELETELENLHVELAFAEMKGPVKDKLRRYGLYERVGEGRFYPTIGVAVHAYVADFQVDWRDWEDVEDEAGGDEPVDRRPRL